jgi:hypothetical protein
VQMLDCLGTADRRRLLPALTWWPTLAEPVRYLFAN